MPTRPIAYVDQPFVRQRFTPDIGTLSQILGRQGDVRAQMAQNAGQAQAATWLSLAAAFNQYQQNQRAKAILQQQQSIRAQERADDLALKNRELSEKEAERKEANRIRLESESRQKRADAIARAGITQPGVISSEMADDLGASGRVQVLDGVPVLMRTPEQVRNAAVDARAEAAAKAAAADRVADNARADKQFAATQANQAATLRIAQQNADTAARKPVSTPKMAAGTADKVAMAQTSLAALDSLEKLMTGPKGEFRAELIGPWAGRYNKAETSAPDIVRAVLPDAPQGFEDFAAETATLKNQVIQAITGAAVGVQEQGRIMSQIPDLTDTPSNWKAKAKATRRNLQELMTNQIRMGTGAEPLQPGTTVEVNLPTSRPNPFRQKP